MSCLDATFTLTPRSPLYSAGPQKLVGLFGYGVDFLTIPPWSLSSLYAADRFYFNPYTAADPNVNFAVWANRMKAHHLHLWVDLRSYGPTKSLALIFGFETWGSGRVLVYNDAGQIADRALAPNDNQFLMEFESLENHIHLYFIHTGGDWFFKGLSGYVV